MRLEKVMVMVMVQCRFCFGVAAEEMMKLVVKRGVDVEEGKE